MVKSRIHILSRPTTTNLSCSLLRAIAPPSGVVRGSLTKRLELSLVPFEYPNCRVSTNISSVRQVAGPRDWCKFPKGSMVEVARYPDIKRVVPSLYSSFPSTARGVSTGKSWGRMGRQRAIKSAYTSLDGSEYVIKARLSAALCSRAMWLEARSQTAPGDLCVYSYNVKQLHSHLFVTLLGYRTMETFANCATDGSSL